MCVGPVIIIYLFKEYTFFLVVVEHVFREFAVQNANTFSTHRHMPRGFRSQTKVNRNYVYIVLYLFSLLLVTCTTECQQVRKQTQGVTLKRIMPEFDLWHL